jgi:membrane protease YdiL (CAAX protease family)
VKLKKVETNPMTTAIVETITAKLKRLFMREDAVYDCYSTSYQAKTPMGKLVYLSLYLLPGILVFIVVNIGPLFRWEMALTGWSARYVQYAWVLIITFGWHIFVPFVVLRYVDKLPLRESCAFLGLNRVDWRGLLTVLPVFMTGFAIISLPYVKYMAPVIEGWTKTITLFQIPSYSIFQDIPENIYSFPPIALLFLGIGNFLGEELYFRGYLMKKSAFLGEANWTVNSVLFGLYHVWQVQQTWPMIGLILMFGVLMKLRKDLWVMVGFHFFVNMWMAYGT